MQISARVLRRILEGLLLFPRRSRVATRARERRGRRGAAHSRRISIRLESNEVPPMSPSLVKWIPRSIAFSFQDWFMPERDLQPGSIAVRRAVSRLVWVFYADIIDSVSLFVAPLRADAARRNAPRMESDLFDGAFYRVPRGADEIHHRLSRARKTNASFIEHPLWLHASSTVPAIRSITKILDANEGRTRNES